jgi:lipopolysaccharide transport system permease protein
MIKSLRFFHFGRKTIYLRDLITELVVREMKLRYKRTVAGMLWSLINPLAQLLVFSLVFGILLPLHIPDYVVFLFIGLLVWNWFQTSLINVTSAIVDNGDLVRQPGFPSPILPVVTITTNLLHFLIAIPILFAFLLIFKITITANVLWLPVIILVQYLFTLSLAYFTSTIHVTFRDTQYLLSIALMLGFYLSPVFYSPESLQDKIATLYYLNPLAILITSYREVLLYGESPMLGGLAIIAAISLGVLVIGYLRFVQASYRFAEEL